MLEGEAICEAPEASVRLVPGDYGVVPMGAPHRWRNDSDTPVRWADMMAPQPQPGVRG